MNPYVIPLNQLGMQDIESVGGKNASLGEMLSHLSRAQVRVPDGFATTAEAYQDFLHENQLNAYIQQRLSGFDVDDLIALAQAGEKIRQKIMNAPLPARLEQEIRTLYAQFDTDAAGSFAVRSSATAEDLPDASFAGQQETFLNIRGIDHVLQAVRAVYASLYNDRAIAYRVHQGYADIPVAISAGVQRMVRSDTGAAGVMFTIDTESGFQDVVFITSSYGLGEMVVQGSVNPDEFYVHKPMLAAGFDAVIRRNIGSKRQRMVFDLAQQVGKSTHIENTPAELCQQFSLNDQQVLELARYAVAIEAHYGKPMDIEWALDGGDGRLYILQARPETVKSRVKPMGSEKYTLGASGKVLTEGRAIGQKIGSGHARIIHDPSEMHRIQPGDVLVSDMTDPNWEPIMKKASAIITNRGGRTCHAAIIARELGIPAIVGCSDATETVQEGALVTASCAEGDTGYVYEGQLPFEVATQQQSLPAKPPVKLMLNIGNPSLAFEFAQLPTDGVGLARLEFIINNQIGIHPKAILEYSQQPYATAQLIQERAQGYASPKEFFIEKLVEGIATIAAAFWPKPVIVRLSDFKSNEYRKLIGGDQFEPQEENPMLGFRGAVRYIEESFRPCFDLECQALKRVRDTLGLDNVTLMVPFVRTLDEARAVVDLLAKNGLKRGENKLRLVMMCEIPANALLADQFLEYFDGFSIGSNDLTQLTLGIDRDSGLVATGFDERNDAVKALLKMAIGSCIRQQKYIGICGQGPSDHPDFASWLMACGIESISLNPDTFTSTWESLSRLQAANPGGS